jgi:hypothetical protein
MMMVQVLSTATIWGNDLGDPALASPGKAGDVKTAKTKHSAKPLETAPAEHSLKKPRRAFTKKQPYENKDNVVQLSAQRAVVYEKSTWKRSQKKPGYLIRRMEGYSIAETEYGVSYLWVLSRMPDLTTADNSVQPLAGYFNWKSLES